VVVAHPLSDAPLELVRTKALGVVGEIVKVLTANPEQLDQEYRDKQYPQPKSPFRTKPMFA
jgi:hypothetical protein